VVGQELREKAEKGGALKFANGADEKRPRYG